MKKQTYWRTAGLIAAAITAGSGIAAGQAHSAMGPNLIQNGDFEEPAMSSSLGFFADGTVPGWTVEYSTDGSHEREPLLEVWHYLYGWDSYSGDQHVELDGYDTIKISQTVPTVPGWQYTLTYAWAPRPSVADNQMKVWLNDEEVGSHAASGEGQSMISWTEATSAFAATSPETSVAFAEFGPNEPSGGLGMLLDGVTLTADCEVNANPTGPTEEQIVIPYSSPDYRYKIVSQGEESGFEAPDYDDAANDFSDGSSAFGHDANQACSLVPVTDWPLNTDILLRKTFTIPPGTNALNVGIAVDNDVQVFINGQEISGSGLQQHEYCATQDSFVFTVPLCLLHGGENLLAVRGRDRGSISYLDVQVTADVPANTLPVANAGPDQSAVQGEEVCFDGSGSSDADGDSLTYLWTLDTWPDGSSAELDNPMAVKPCFTADLPGTYTVSLTVNDGTVDSAPNTASAVAISYSEAINQFCPCEGPRGKTVSWKNHGQYVRCVTQTAANFFKQKLITKQEKKEVVNTAAQNDCGKHTSKGHCGRNKHANDCGGKHNNNDCSNNGRSHGERR
jgi:hypothetical protein